MEDKVEILGFQFEPTRAIHDGSSDESWETCSEESVSSHNMQETIDLWCKCRGNHPPTSMFQVCVYLRLCHWKFAR